MKRLLRRVVLVSLAVSVLPTGWVFGFAANIPGQSPKEASIGIFSQVALSETVVWSRSAFGGLSEIGQHVMAKIRRRIPPRIPRRSTVKRPPKRPGRRIGGTRIGGLIRFIGEAAGSAAGLLQFQPEFALAGAGAFPSSLLFSVQDPSNRISTSSNRDKLVQISQHLVKAQAEFAAGKIDEARRSAQDLWHGDSYGDSWALGNQRLRDGKTPEELAEIEKLVGETAQLLEGTHLLQVRWMPEVKAALEGSRQPIYNGNRLAQIYLAESYRWEWDPAWEPVAGAAIAYLRLEVMAALEDIRTNRGNLDIRPIQWARRALTAQGRLKIAPFRRARRAVLLYASFLYQPVHSPFEAPIREAREQLQEEQDESGVDRPYRPGFLRNDYHYLVGTQWRQNPVFWAALAQAADREGEDLFLTGLFSDPFTAEPILRTISKQLQHYPWIMLTLINLYSANPDYTGDLISNVYGDPPFLLPAIFLSALTADFLWMKERRYQAAAHNFMNWLLEKTHLPPWIAEWHDDLLWLVVRPGQQVFFRPPDSFLLAHSHQKWIVWHRPREGWLVRDQRTGDQTVLVDNKTLSLAPDLNIVFIAGLMSVAWHNPLSNLLILLRAPPTPIMDQKAVGPTVKKLKDFIKPPRLVRNIMTGEEKFIPQSVKLVIDRNGTVFSEDMSADFYLYLYLGSDEKGRLRTSFTWPYEEGSNRGELVAAEAWAPPTLLAALAILKAQPNESGSPLAIAPASPLGRLYGWLRWLGLHRTADLLGTYGISWFEVKKYFLNPLPLLLKEFSTVARTEPDLAAEAIVKLLLERMAADHLRGYVGRSDEARRLTAIEKRQSYQTWEAWKGVSKLRRILSASFPEQPDPSELRRVQLLLWWEKSRSNRAALGTHPRSFRRAA